MDNRPIALKEPIIAFKNSDLTIKLNYPEGYTMPAEIEMELWVGAIKAQIGNPIVADITGESAEISIDKSIVKILPSQADAYFLHDGNFLFGAKFFVQSGLAENVDPIEMSVSFNGDQVIVVEVMGFDIINGQVQVATEQAQIATQNAQKTEGDRVATELDRIQTGQDRQATDLAVSLVANKIPTISIAELKGTTNPSFSSVYLSDVNKEGIFYLDNSAGSPDDALIIQDTSGNKWVRRGYDYLKPEWFGAIGDGVANDTVAISKMLSVDMPQIRFGRNKNYRITTTQILDKSYDIDFNGSTLTSSASFLRLSPPVIVYTSESSYFTTVKLSNHFQKIIGVTDNLVVGDVLYLYSNTPRPILGDYFNGMVVRVIDISDTDVYISHPFYDTFDVNRISVYKGRFLRLKNGTIRLTGASGYKGIQASFFDNVLVENFKTYGLSNNQAGMDLTGVDVMVRDYFSSGFRDTTGIDGGRLGYGLSAYGSNVTVENISGNNCKHVFTSGGRSFMTLDLRVTNFQGYNPPEFYNLSSGVSGGGPMYQGIFDVHANCQRLHLVNPTIEGCNTLIAIRNGHAIIDNPILRSNGAQLGFNNRYLICIYEAPTRQIVVNNPNVYVDIYEGQTEIPAFIGIQVSQVSVGQHESIQVNNLVQDGGRLFGMEPSSGTAYSTDVNLRELIFRNVDVKVQSGINLKGFDSSFLLGIINKIQLHGKVVLDGRTGAIGPILNIENATRVDELICKDSYFDGRTLSSYSLFSTVFAAVSASPFKLIDFSNSELHSGAAGFVTSNSPGNPYGTGRFRNTRIYHNYAGTSSFVPGLYASMQNGVDEWDLTDVYIENKNLAAPLTNHENIRAMLLSKFNIKGGRFNTTLALDQTYWTSLAQAAAIPSGVRGAGGFLSFAGKRLKPDGKLYILAASQTNAGTKSALPNGITVDYAGQILYNESVVAGAPSYWIGTTGTTWVPETDYNTVYYHQANLASSDNLNSYSKNGIFSVVSQAIADTLVNLPVATSGILEVHNLSVANTSTSCIQMYTTTPSGVHQNKRFSRVCNAGTWSSWKEITTELGYTASPDANYTIPAANTVTQLGTPTADRTLTLPAAASNTGKTLTVFNRNTGTFAWNVASPYFRDTAGLNVTSIPLNSAFILISDGTAWRMIGGATVLPISVTNTSTGSAPNKSALNSAYGTAKAGSVITYPSLTGSGHTYRKLTDDSGSDWQDTNWGTGLSSLVT